MAVTSVSFKKVYVYRGVHGVYGYARVNTVQSDSIIKLRTEIEEREKLNYEAKGIITNQRSEIEKLRGLLRDVYKETENFLIKERAGFSDLGWHQRAAEFDNLLTRINAALGESEEK